MATRHKMNQEQLCERLILKQSTTKKKKDELKSTENISNVLKSNH